MTNEYSYNEVREAALSKTATAEDRIALYEWMENYAMREWNGEYFDIDNGLQLFPVYEEKLDEDGEIEELILVDAEIR